MNFNLPLFKDRMLFKGELTLTCSDGRVIQKRNTLVNGSLTVMQALLLQSSSLDAPRDNMLHSIYVGWGSTPAQEEDEWLEFPLDKMVIADVDKTIETDHIKVETLLPAISPANGFTLTEAGLVTRGAVSTPVLPGPVERANMFSRAVHVGVPKSLAISIRYTWRIYLTL